MLDEPTAALGVAQTAEVLNLIERLRERGLGVILISHNMADVMAVADRIVVLRLGRNNGDFHVSQTSSQEIIAAITGATEQRRRRSAPHVGPRRRSVSTPSTPDQSASRPRREELQPGSPADLQDERLIASAGSAARVGLHRAGCAAATSARCRWSSAWS